MVLENFLTLKIITFMNHAISCLTNRFKFLLAPSLITARVYFKSAKKTTFLRLAVDSLFLFDMHVDGGCFHFL